MAVKIIQAWNDLNSPQRQLVLLPVRWETPSAPEYGKRPQEVINRQVVDNCDLLMGSFRDVPATSLLQPPSDCNRGKYLAVYVPRQAPCATA